ncbi:HNH endonuclease signature motif containing protein [Corynebacterium atypicum]|uniref:HNH endonuclease signature motif containing protein n=1 Tax=Corynebacterium atypicum TaxID=191610 RepID=UPI0011851B91|nr:HNH endonuclease signature motif containing protein [Corynebacterium atypicum]
MNIVELWDSIAGRGMELVEHYYQIGKTTARAKEEIAKQFCVPSVTAGRWLRMSRSLLAPIENPEAGEEALRRATNALCAERGWSIDHLLAAYTPLRHLAANAPASREQTRAWVVARCDGLSVDEVKALTTSRVRELNAGVEVVTRASRRYLRASRTSDAHGMRYATICLPEDAMAGLMRELHEQAEMLRKKDHTLTHQQAMADALTYYRCEPQPHSQYLQPAVLLTMDDLEGQGDGTFATTDGTLLTVEEFASMKLSEYGLCLVYDDKDQPVDLFRTRRMANDKQRAILALDQVLCAEPTCTHTVATCQAHHVKAWAEGGETNLDNLVGACRMHNARNDDNLRWKGRNGRLERCPRTGKAGWRRPGAHCVSGEGTLCARPNPPRAENLRPFQALALTPVRNFAG